MTGARTVGGSAAGRRPGGGFSGSLTLIHRNNSPKSMPMRVAAGFAMPEKSWLEGVHSGQSGTANCPYKVGTTDAWSWSSGYVEGRANAGRST